MFFQKVSLFLAGILFLIVAMIVAGCSQDHQPAEPSGSTHHGEHQHHDHAHGEGQHGLDAVSTGEPVDRSELDDKSRKALDEIMAAYLAIQQQLADDDMRGVSLKVEELHDAAHVLMRSEAPGVHDRARAVSRTVHDDPGDLDEARAIFKDISAAMTELVSVVRPGEDVAPSIYQGYCDMEEANWLQTEAEIVNPYMGHRMLRCGTIEEMPTSAAAG